MTLIELIRRTMGRGPRADPPATGPAIETAASTPASPSVAIATATGTAIEIAPTDPLFAYLQATSGVVDAERLELDSPALAELQAAHVRVIVPLVAQGELIGMLYLGPRLSDQDYSADDRRLLTTLAAQAAPAIRVGQLVREQAGRSRRGSASSRRCGSRTLIQQQFLPRELPQLPDWQVVGVLRPGAGGRRRLLRLHRAARRPDRDRRRVTSPTRASPRRWSWPARSPSCAARRRG